LYLTKRKQKLQLNLRNPFKAFSVDQSVVMCQYEPKISYDSIEVICTISNTVSHYNPSFEKTCMKLLKFGNSLQFKKSNPIQMEQSSEFIIPKEIHNTHIQMKLDIGTATCCLSDDFSKLVFSSSFGISFDSTSVTQFTSDKNLISFHYSTEDQIMTKEVMKIPKVSLKVFDFNFSIF
jgi:hypothetical protein